MATILIMGASRGIGQAIAIEFAKLDAKLVLSASSLDNLKETEKKIHCGQATRPFKGYRWMNNDLVNLGASIFGGFTAVVVYHLLTWNIGTNLL